MGTIIGKTVIIAELWRPEVAKRGNFVRFFCVFLKKRPLAVYFKNSVPKVFTASPIDVILLKCCKICPVKSCVIYLTKNGISAASQTVATARIAPKICQGHPPTMCSQCFRFHPNRFTFGGVIAKRVNTVFLPRRVFPWFTGSYMLRFRRILVVVVVVVVGLAVVVNLQHCMQKFLT